MSVAYSPVSEAPFKLDAVTQSALYTVIELRRDIRHFEPQGEVEPAALSRILAAAHAAPSVGLSQPWRFVLVRDRERRARIRASFLACRERESELFAEPRKSEYRALRLEGISDSTLNICVAVDLREREETTLGTSAQPHMLRFSVCCAIQNLWLAARVEGVGVGWVSIVSTAVLKHELALPEGVEPVGYLCVGKPIAFRKTPMLEELGWAKRRPLEQLLHEDTWQE